METKLERIEREDLVLFMNACFACTSQNEFYSSSSKQSVSVEFLHLYFLHNYRRVYSRFLATTINDFNKTKIVENLLHAGTPTNPDAKAEENALIGAAIDALPPQRVYRLFTALTSRRVNNRRTRAVMKRFVNRRDHQFDAVKYRRKLRKVARHAHLEFPDETHQFLFPKPGNKTPYKTEIYETFRQAHYSNDALYQLPFTVAQGLAQKKGISQANLLKNSQRMTAAERLKYQNVAQKSKVSLSVDLHRAGLTKLSIYICSLTLKERKARYRELDTAMRNAARRAHASSPYQMGNVVAVLDRSFSTTSSYQKRNRPLALALAVSYLLEEVASTLHRIWTPALNDVSLNVVPFGQTNLARPVLASLKHKPDSVIIVSDGFENAPAGLVGQAVETFVDSCERGDTTSFVHLNPVFDSENYQPKTLGQAIPTVGIRNAEDLATSLSFVRFAGGHATLAELENYLKQQVQDLITTGDSDEI